MRGPGTGSPGRSTPFPKAVEIEVFRHLSTALTDAMGAALERSAYALAPAPGGSMSGVELRLPQANVVHASLPASVAAGNVETSQRVTDVLPRAFGRALLDRIPALPRGP